MIMGFTIHDSIWCCRKDKRKRVWNRERQTGRKTLLLQVVIIRWSSTQRFGFLARPGQHHGLSSLRCGRFGSGTRRRCASKRPLGWDKTRYTSPTVASHWHWPLTSNVIGWFRIILIQKNVSSLHLIIATVKSWYGFMSRADQQDKIRRQCTIWPIWP